MRTDMIKDQLKDVIVEGLYTHDLHVKEIKKCFDVTLLEIQKDIDKLKSRASYLG